MYPLLRPLLFRFDPEFIHGVALFCLANPLLRAMLAWRTAPPRRPVSLWGLTFRNPVGLAAGFDKDGVAVAAWDRLGFGFCEVGTVTRHAQPGNPRPRIFRYPRERALVNRLGFPNQGARAVAERLLRERARRPRTDFPIGINIGKSKIVPNEEAAADYLESFRILFDAGDYFVVNVSSPNTPGLRDLQDPRTLEPILARLQEENHARGPKPLLVKIAPDLEAREIEEIVALAERLGLAGMAAVNTTTRHAMTETGGLSGAPLATRADEVIRRIRDRSGGRLPVIGVGGIFDHEDLGRRLDAGATLVQLYTGFVYRGPRVVYDLLDGYHQ